MCVTTDTADDVQRPIKVTLQYSGVTPGCRGWTEHPGYCSHGPTTPSLFLS